MVSRFGSLAFLLALSSAAATARGAGFFGPTAGPDGRAARDVAAGPGGDLYAIRDVREVYALGAGDRWGRLTDPPAPITDLEVAPDGQIWVFGYGNQFVSEDGGGSWQAPGAVPAITGLTFDAQGRALAGTASGLYRSPDRGASWAPLALPAQAVSVVEADAAAIWVAIGTQLWRSGDQGETWSPFATLPDPATALASHPQGGAYAGIANAPYPTCRAGGMFRIDAAGQVSPLGLTAYAIRDILVQADGSVLASAGDPCWYRSACGGCPPDCGTSGVYRSTDSGATWTLVSGTPGIPGQIVTRAGGGLFTASQSTSCDICWTVAPGVLRSTDAGASWTAVNTGLGKTGVHWVAAPQGGTTVLAANSTSIYLSGDRGQSWTLAGDPSPTLCAQVYGSIGFAALGPVAFAFEEYPTTVHRVLPGWTSTVQPVPSVSIFRDMTVTGNGVLVLAADRIYVAPDPIDSGFLPFAFGPSGIARLAPGVGRQIAGATSTHTWLSNDDGFSWTNIAAVGNGPLAFSRDGFTLYVAQSASNEVRPWRLRAVNNWLPEPVPAFAAPATAVLDLLVDSSGALWVIAQFAYISTGHILRLAPGAVAWQEIDTHGSTTRFALGSDGYLYLATFDGVWRSAGPVGGVTDAASSGPFVDAVTSFPNPITERARIAFRLAHPASVHLAVYDVRGRLVGTPLADRKLGPGSHAAIWEPAPGTPNGVYVYRLRTPAEERRGRMLLVR